MSTKDTYAEIIVGAEGLLAAVKANFHLLPNIEEQQMPLELGLNRIKDLRALQKTLTADKQRATQELVAAFREVRDLTIQLRAAIRAKIGVRSEKLVEFQVPPLRKRTRKSKPAEPEETKKMEV